MFGTRHRDGSPPSSNPIFLFDPPSNDAAAAAGRDSSFPSNFKNTMHDFHEGILSLSPNQPQVKFENETNFTP